MSKASDASKNRKVLTHYTWNGMYPWNGSGGPEYKCNHCAVLFKTSHRVRYWNVASDKDLVTLRDHLVNLHNLVDCPLCGQNCTKRGLKKHQSGAECKAAVRAKFWEDAGYVALDATELRYLEGMYDTLHRALVAENWQDQDYQQFLTHERTKHLETLMSKLDMTEVLSSKEYNWAFQKWVPWEAHRFFELLMSSRLNSSSSTQLDSAQEFMDQLCMFAEGDDNVRANMTGMLELANEQDGC